MEVPGRLRARRGHAIAAALLLALAGSVGLAAALPAGQTLVVTDTETDAVLVRTPVTDGTTVTLAYTHSVERTPVEDVYVVRGGTLDNVEMRFQSYGWGLPARADVHRENGSFVFDPDRRYDELFVKPGRIAGHRLMIDDPSTDGDATTVDLVARSDARTVRIAVERRSALDTLLPDATIV